MDEGTVDEGSLFEELMLESATPMPLRIGAREWLIEVPRPDEVAGLDLARRADEVLDELAGADADALLDELERHPWGVTVRVAEDLQQHFALVDPPPGGWGELVWRLDRFGADIEWDLRHYLMLDLADWFRGRRPWPQLYRRLEQLPAGSRYGAAVLGDEDLARRDLDADDEDEPERDRRRPPLQGETYDRQLLRAAVSALLRIEHATYAVHAPKGQRRVPPRPLPGPLTARERLAEELGLVEVDEITRAVTGQAAPGRDDEAAPAGFDRTASGLWVPDS